MGNLLRTIFDFVIWIFVPFILFMIIRYLRGIHKRAEDPRYADATKSGFRAGFILFIIMLIYEVGGFLKAGFPDREIYQGIDLPLALLGAIVGFVLFSGGKRVLPAQVSGWITLVMTFISFYALLHYLFIRTYNEPLLSLILGITFGALAHSATSPTTLQEFLHPGSSEHDTHSLL
ncbi:hypothetical protein C4571_03605 [Candidatus Parcubacteria bacterium]|nr:MAG: hypothetical protein C4571_03605 [Candidatus Parcubacteria bacterium]